MKALLLFEPGPVSSLDIGDIPIPEPGPNEIRVKVHAVSLNPVDYKLLAVETTTGHTRMCSD